MRIFGIPFEINRKDAEELRKDRKEYHYKLFTTLFIPFFNSATLKLINKPSL